MDISRNSKDTLIIQLPTSQPVMVIVCSMTYKSFCVERKACQWSSSTNGVWRWYLTGKRFSNIGIRQFVVCIARLRWNFHQVCQCRRLFNRDNHYCLEKYHQNTESLYPLVNSATNVTTRTLNRVFHVIRAEGYINENYVDTLFHTTQLLRRTGAGLQTTSSISSITRIPWFIQPDDFKASHFVYSKTCQI